jgi:hypothetical protein
LPQTPLDNKKNWRISAPTVRPSSNAAGRGWWKNCGNQAADLDTLRQLVERVREFAALRETSRHYLLLGYSILRQCLVELGRRWHLGDGIFYLTPEEIERLIGLPVRSADSAAVMPQNTSAVGDQHVSAADTSWHQVRQAIRQRRRERQIALTLEVPTVLFSDDLEALGRPIQVSGADTVQGIAVSPGVGEGPALVFAGTASAWHTAGLRPGVPIYRSGVGAALPPSQRFGYGNRRSALARCHCRPRVRFARCGRHSGRLSTLSHRSTAPRQRQHRRSAAARGLTLTGIQRFR